MKTETFAVIAVAAVLTFSGRGAGSGCAPGGCLLQSSDFEKAATTPLHQSKSRQQSERPGGEIGKPERFGSVLSELNGRPEHAR